MNAWDNLSISDKADVMKVAIRNGIKNIADIREAYNSFAEGGDTTNTELPFQSDQVLDRANQVFTNYDEAVDFNMDPNIYSLRNFMYQNEIPHSGLSNCTLTATQWIDPSNPIKSAHTIVSNPSNSGYTQIRQEEIVPGDLMISKNPQNGSYHTMLVESINKDGSPNLRYSTGGPNNDSLRFGVSQREYHKRDNSQGGNHTKDMFFRYNRPNEVWLPEVVVTGRKKALGGNLFGGGGAYSPSDAIKNRIAKWEGKAMTESTVDPLSGRVVPKNNSFENEAAAFTRALPESIRGAVLANPELADNLFSYSYNVGAGKFRNRVVPALEAYFSGNGSVDDVEKSMWASGDAKLRGLQRRRAEEKAGVRSALENESTQQQSTAFAQYPELTEDIFKYNAPVIDETLIQQQPEAKEITYDPRQEVRNNLSSFAAIMSLMNPNSDSPYINALNMASDPLSIIGQLV